MKYLNSFLIVISFSIISACSSDKNAKQTQIKDTSESYIVKIKKRVISLGYFHSLNYISQELFFIGTDLVSLVNYAYNGWQIYDSISYEKQYNGLCKKTFTPFYDEKERFHRKYILSKTDYIENVGFSNQYLNKIDDDYLLSRFYLKNLDFLLNCDYHFSSNISSDECTFSFKGNIIPSFFMEYGLGFDEVLNSFMFIISEDNLLEKDVFFFENCTVTRVYEYSKHRLQKVTITVSEKENIISTFQEYYELHCTPRSSEVVK